MKPTDPELQSRYRPIKSVLLTIRVTPYVSQKLKEKNLSPTGIFYAALKELDILPQ